MNNGPWGPQNNNSGPLIMSPLEMIEYLDQSERNIKEWKKRLIDGAKEKDKKDDEDKRKGKVLGLSGDKIFVVMLIMTLPLLAVASTIIRVSFEIIKNNMQAIFG